MIIGFVFKKSRRKRDSNPRTCYSQRFSRPPHSTALPFLQYVSNHCLIADANIATFSVSANTIQAKLIFFFTTGYNSFKTFALAKINIQHTL